MAGAILLIAWEWARLAGLVKKQDKLIFVFSVAAILITLCVFLNISPNSDDIDRERARIILFFGAVFWIFSVYILRGYPGNSKIWNDSSIIIFMGLIVTVSAWSSVVQLKYIASGGELLLIVVILVAVADIGAFFFGKTFGRTKLAPELSPNKTWEGVLGAFSSGVFICIPGAWILNKYIFELTSFQIAILFSLSLMISFFSIVGDLFESMLKRNQNLKDSGFVLPGHGGILDRVDGLIAVLPIFTLVMLRIY
jgi:phosphatidate cytidylyltransferase